MKLRGEGARQACFTILYVTPEMMATDSHNSCEDVTVVTDEWALWAACVHVSQSRFIYPWKGRLLRTVLQGILPFGFLFCSILCVNCKRCHALVCIKVKVKSSRIINAATFDIMLNPETAPGRIICPN